MTHTGRVGAEGGCFPHLLISPNTRTSYLSRWSKRYRLRDRGKLWPKKAMLWVKICLICPSFTVLSPKHQARKTEQGGRTDLECQSTWNTKAGGTETFTDKKGLPPLLFILPHIAGLESQPACQQDAANYSSLSRTTLQVKQQERTWELAMK